ncbi:hypothetical protein HDN1F_35520 [gamma proteobacterium HdN1]|nr:Hypothetical protein HDN1F_17670 [gamma proteobacterium HdN1]CBL47135.1 hypothetical protein HDN1F_35520 [gamma proteobacterium HdN1]
MAIRLPCITAYGHNHFARYTNLPNRKPRMSYEAQHDSKLTEAIRKRAGTANDEKARPGPIVPKATIRLHTNIAHQLFFGRAPDPNRPFRDQCFASFANNLSALWTFAQADDPYADAKLILIEEQIKAAREQIGDLTELLNELVESLQTSGIRIDAHQSTRPIDVPIAFRAVHAAVAIQLLGAVDSAIQKALLARHFGLISGQDWQRVLANSATPMRHLFKLALFRASGATRADFALNNDRAKVAVEKLGELPADILAGVRRPLLGPRTSNGNGTSLLFGESRAATDNSDDSIVAQSLRAIEAAHA